MEWARLLVRGGRILFTDSSVLTGAVAKGELDIRGGIGFFLVVPLGLDEEAIEAAGLILLKREDRTVATAEVAARLDAARARRAAALEREEGADWFEKRQRLLATTAELVIEAVAGALAIETATLILTIDYESDAPLG